MVTAEVTDIRFNDDSMTFIVTIEKGTQVRNVELDVDYDDSPQAIEAAIQTITQRFAQFFGKRYSV